MKYTRKVYRDNNGAIYEIYRNGELVCKEVLEGFGLPFYRMFTPYNRMIELLLIKANKDSLKAIKIMTEQEFDGQ